MTAIARCPNGHPVPATVAYLCKERGCDGAVAYEPAAKGMPLDRQLQGAVNTSLRQVRKALEEIRDERPDDARHTLSFLADWLDHHAGGQ